ncbi:hypothetical protein HUJ04_009961 [Dendroctonus ponderosae]|nr:hypothetical protein HUJ04_009961 [Dendroctonus ponderosae]
MDDETYGFCEFSQLPALCSCGESSKSFVTNGRINTEIYLGLASCHYGMRAVEWCQMNKVVLVPREANPPNCSEVCAIERYWALESESVDHECVGHGVDCLGGRPHQPAGPFHYLINEQAKSLVALQELQNEVGALLEFRDLVMETFPNLRSKLHQQNSANSTPATMTGHHVHHSNIPISIRPGDWTPGIRVRKKLGISSGKEKKSGSESAAASSTSAVQDSGFSTEASSKETHSASSTVPTSNSATGTSETDETEDELWSLLDIIHRKGTRLKDEVEALQGTLRDQTPFGDPDGNFQRDLFHSSADDLRQLRQERDLLLDRLAEMEAEVLAGRLHTSRLQEDLENLMSAKHDLEEQLKAIVSQRGEVNSRIHDLHLQFVAKSASDEKLKLLSGDRKESSQIQPVWTTPPVLSRRLSCSELDTVLGNQVRKVSMPNRKKIAAILREQDPVVLQKHLLVSTVQNQESESVDHECVGHGVDCLGGRPHQPAGPFHYLINEQAKSLVALQELQNEVGALLEFRDLVMETFPNLRSKLHQQNSANSTPATMTGHHVHHSNIPISIRPGDWTPGIRVRKKLGISSGKEKKSGSESAAASSTSAVQDSGFSTEASSKETHSASSTVPTSNSATGTSETDETEDELWSLLDIIHRKGTRLKDEVEALQGTLRDQTPFGDPDGNFQRDLFHSSADDLRQLRQERDLLLDRLAEMEAEVLAGRLHTSRLQEDLENLMSAKHDLEEQLKAIVSQRGEVNSRIHDLHLQFVAKSASDEKLKLLSGDRKESSQIQPVWTTPPVLSRRLSCSELDTVLGNQVRKVSMPNRKKIAAILREQDPVVLQKHLLVSTVQNQILNSKKIAYIITSVESTKSVFTWLTYPKVLKQQLDTAGGLELGLRQRLDKAVEENEDLRFELENRTIELEGTKARVRVLEDLHKPNVTKSTSPDIIPDLHVTQDQRPSSRTEISTASMKAMSPLPMNLQMDHSSSTESAHDQTESNKSKDSSGSKRRPSKIPLKSYTAPKPPGVCTLENILQVDKKEKRCNLPGAKIQHTMFDFSHPPPPYTEHPIFIRHHAPAGKHSPAPRSRSGESPHRSHSSHSWRNRSAGGGGGAESGSLKNSLPKSRNSSLISARDSLSSKLRGTDSLAKSNSPNQQNSLKKTPSSKWTAPKDEKIQGSTSPNGKSLSPWILSSYNNELPDYPDSLMDKSSVHQTTTDSESHRFHTANTFLWETKNVYYDSIDTRRQQFDLIIDSKNE